jgi:hypothetical protein
MPEFRLGPDALESRELRSGCHSSRRLLSGDDRGRQLAASGPQLVLALLPSFGSARRPLPSCSGTTSALSKHLRSARSRGASGANRIRAAVRKEVSAPATVRPRCHDESRVQCRLVPRRVRIALERSGNDLVLVAELAGHRRLETTRRYSLPSAADRQAAMDASRSSNDRSRLAPNSVPVRPSPVRRSAGIRAGDCGTSTPHRSG